LKELFQVLFENCELLVVHKPAGLVCHPTKTDEFSSLISRVRLYFGKDSHPQLVNRLDRETSGVTLIAKSADAARELRQIWENRRVEKEYLAIVRGHPAQSRGLIDAPIGPDEHSIVAVKDCVRPDGAPAQTDFRVEKTFFKTPSVAAQVAEEGMQEAFPFALLRVVPRTGRKHQIRIHLAHIGHPLVGEKLYGGDEDLYMALVENRLTPEQTRRLILPYQALHAVSVRFTWRGSEWKFSSAAEEWFQKFLESSG
jgi:23S rRNA pseudouridine1911/1915/1917 synthase